MITKIKEFQKDFSNSKIEQIGISKQTGDLHFVIKKGKKYVGFAVSPDNIKTFEYKEI